MSSNQLEFFLSADPELEAEAITAPQEKPALFLLDGMAIIYRSFFCLATCRHDKP